MPRRLISMAEEIAFYASAQAAARRAAALIRSIA
jgi:hypothetical protein